MENKLPAYWNFAVTTAIEQLGQLVFHFDIEAEAGINKRYVDVKPTWVLEIIESLLTERERLDNPKIERLNKLRDAVHTSIMPSYQSGKDSAHAYWKTIDNERRNQVTEIEFPEFRALAKPYFSESFTESEKSWFVEGFCVEFMGLWMGLMADLLK